MKDELLTPEQWGERKSDKCPHLPYISKPDGSTLHETVDILEHLAVMGGKFVVDANQKAMATKINGPPFMCVDPYLNLPEPAWADLGVPPFAEFPAMIAPELKKLAEELGDKKFFAGDTPGYGEAFLWHNLNNIKTCCHDEVCTAVGDEAVMKKLIEYHDRFAALPGIKEYLAGRSQKCGAPGSKGQA